MTSHAGRVGAIAAGVAVIVLVVVEITRPSVAPAGSVPPSAFLDQSTIQAALGYRTPLRWVSVLSILLRAGTAGAVLWWVGRRPDDILHGGRWRLARIGLLGAGVWALTDLVRLPLQAWVWRRALDVGLSTQDLSGWVRDWVIQTIPYWLGVALAVMGAAWLRERWPASWVPLAGGLGGLVGAVLIVISPVFFEPLLFDFTPLEEGPLREGIAELADRAEGGDDAEILVADASRRTTTSNAYVSGIGTTRRIVLYDNLLDDARPAQVLAIVAHELGHDVHHDVERAAASLMALAVLAVWAVDRLVGRRLTGPEGRVTGAGAVRAVAVVIILVVVLAPVERWSSRRSEAAADAAALELIADPEDYRSMLVGLARRNLSDPAPPAWTVGLFYSHPPIASRIARAETGS